VSERKSEKRKGKKLQVVKMTIVNFSQALVFKDEQVGTFLTTRNHSDSKLPACLKNDVTICSCAFAFPDPTASATFKLHSIFKVEAYQ
jgi:hypothetical protein